ncbi:hypothetical protein [Devosia sp. Root413D1]|uniref:hypothetical protein n=1 Tax=Devosia sp. Root413D1 TaxID=1736531 RepID=UPI0012E3F809|nr:hypothetical protein [Devosia sp. Root413D1]
MKAVLTALAAALLSTAGALAQSPTGAAIEQILVERIDTAEQNVGIVVAVIENGAPRFVSYGHPALGDARTVDEHTVFDRLGHQAVHQCAARRAGAGRQNRSRCADRELPASGHRAA